jgi:hypothetical protein
LKKSLAGSASPRSAKRANIGISSLLFSIGYGSQAAVVHMSTSFSRMNPLLRRASKSSVFAFNFFHSRFGSGRGGDIDGAALPANPAASSRLLFFPPAAFAVLDGDDFILRFTASSHAFARGLPRWLSLAAHSDLQQRRALAVIPAKIYSKWLQLRWVKNPKGFGFYL